MKKILVILSIGISFILVGCNQSSTEEDGSSAMIVIVNNAEYTGTEDPLDASKPIGEKMSTITKQTKATESPKENNQSNYFPVESTIYSVKGTEDYIIVEDDEHKQWLLQKVREIK